jgi:hydrogenase nickel incorporation protein HypA/HybF
MHELSICESIARAVVDHAGGRRVRSVKLRVGALRQVVPDTLAFCWEVAARGPLLEGSVLDVELVPGEVACPDCGTRSTLTRFTLRCPDCGGSVTVVAGDDLLVESIEVDGDEPGAVPAAAADVGTTGARPGRDVPGSGEE